VKTIAQIRDEIALLKADLMGACEPSRAAQCAVDRLVEADAWLAKCRQRAPAPAADPTERTPVEGLPRRRSGEWPQVGGDE
jgi:hypothetical protein